VRYLLFFYAEQTHILAVELPTVPSTTPAPATDPLRLNPPFERLPDIQLKSKYIESRVELPEHGIGYISRGGSGHDFAEKSVIDSTIS
jgi:hypothetical protein